MFQGLGMAEVGWTFWDRRALDLICKAYLQWFLIIEGSCSLGWGITLAECGRCMSTCLYNVLFVCMR